MTTMGLHKNFKSKYVYYEIKIVSNYVKKLLVKYY